MSLTVVIPLPHAALNPHAKGSRWPKIKATKEHREEARLCALESMGKKGPRPYFDRVTITPTFYCAPKPGDNRYRPMDGTNAAASLKAAVDGLVDAGIVGKDTHEFLRMMPPVLLRRKDQHGGKAKVVLEIEEWVADDKEGRGR